MCGKVKTHYLHQLQFELFGVEPLYFLLRIGLAWDEGSHAASPWRHERAMRRILATRSLRCFISDMMLDAMLGLGARRFQWSGGFPSRATSLAGRAELTEACREKTATRPRTPRNPIERHAGLVRL
jgi:hypothetical protein